MLDDLRKLTEPWFADGWPAQNCPTCWHELLEAFRAGEGVEREGWLEGGELELGIAELQRGDERMRVVESAWGAVPGLLLVRFRRPTRPACDTRSLSSAHRLSTACGTVLQRWDKSHTALHS